MRILLQAAVVAVTLACYGAPAAFAEAIDCPLPEARRTITNTLPSGWWTTPIVNDLSETRIQEIGGETALVCVYGASGSVQRNAPEGQVCTARDGGFDCAARVRVTPPAPRPQTFRTGPLQVPQTYLFDLDSGDVGSGGDIWFHAVTSTELYLEPRGGAQMAVGDRSNRGFAGCSSASYSTTRARLEDVPVGSYVCVRTNEGRIAQFRVNAVSSGSPKTLSLGYTTWR